jgi:diaminopimelate epimerase
MIFDKYSANGNDFIILKDPGRDLSSFVLEKMCDRHFGIGADGVLYLLKSDRADARMRIFNSDGGEAEMCANGLRALVHHWNGLQEEKKPSYKIETMNGIYEVLCEDGRVQIEMSEISDKNLYQAPQYHDFEKSFFINTGVPHLVLLGPNRDLKIKELGARYRFDQRFPKGSNVNFVEVLSRGEQKAYVRTYERGVEDETLSCGTGLTATALALSEWFGWKGVIHLSNKGGNQEVLIDQRVYYSGDITFSFRGEYPL